MTPQSRQWLYNLSMVASAIVPVLVAYKVIGTDVAGAWVNVIGVLGVLATGGTATAAMVLAKQRRDGTLDFTGSAAEQAVAAIQATVQQASQASDNLEAVKTAVTNVLSTNVPVADDVVSGSLVQQLLDAVNEPK